MLPMAGLQHAAPLPVHRCALRVARQTHCSRLRPAGATFAGSRPVTSAVAAALATLGARCLVARRARRRPRTSAGRGLPLLSGLEDLWRRRLRVTATLCAVLVAVWILQGITGWRMLEAYNASHPSGRLPGSAGWEGWLFSAHSLRRVGGRPMLVTLGTLERDFRMDSVLVSMRGQWHRLLTGCFLHAGVFHILCNVGYLYTLAPLETGASGAYLTTFMLAGIGGSWAHMAFSEHPRAVGASGALCGIIGFELVELARNRQFRRFRAVLKQTFGMLVMGLVLPGVSNWSHVGGLLSGAAVALLSAPRSGYRRALLPWPFLLLLVFGAIPAGRQFVFALVKGLAIGIMSPGRLGQGVWIR